MDASEAISLVSDIVVLMTYGLHGQWDYGSTFSDPPNTPTADCTDDFPDGDVARDYFSIQASCAYH